jgi:hypothetical protein
MHCKADKGLHRWDTMQCPKGGHEAYGSQKEIWLGTVYTEDNSGELAILYGRIAELEAQVARLLEAVPSAGQVKK